MSLSILMVLYLMYFVVDSAYVFGAVDNVEGVLVSVVPVPSRIPWIGVGEDGGSP